MLDTMDFKSQMCLERELNELRLKKTFHPGSFLSYFGDSESCSFGRNSDNGFLEQLVNFGPSVFSFREVAMGSKMGEKEKGNVQPLVLSVPFHKTQSCLRDVTSFPTDLLAPVIFLAMDH